MEDTLGRRISGYRKKLGMTQDQLAEKLGVTAQAVSKWENDQSCPDIWMLPRLARLFQTSTDELLGVEKMPEPLSQPEMVETEQEEPHGSVEINLDAGRKSGVGLALWLLLAGGLLIAANLNRTGVDLWTALWTTGLFAFGVMGLWPKFSVFRLGCAAFGALYAWNALYPASFLLERSLLLPIILLLLGLSVLTDAFKKNSGSVFHIVKNGKSVSKNEYREDAGQFRYTASFADAEKRVALPYLKGGKAQLQFGEMLLDLTGCEKAAPECAIDVSCAFGELTLRLPSRWKADMNVSTSFGALEEGTIPSQAVQTLRVSGRVSFGSVRVEYV